jgi:hypothetical protein
VQEESDHELRRRALDSYVIISNAISVVVSIAAIAVAYLAFRISQQATNLQTYMRYFDANNFELEHWEIVSPLSPLGKCKNLEEATVRTFLYHRLNRLLWESDIRQIKRHKSFTKSMFGSRLSQFQSRLKYSGVDEELIKTAAQVLVAIRFDDPYFASNHRFWSEYFGDGYFDDAKHT